MIKRFAFFFFLIFCISAFCDQNKLNLLGEWVTSGHIFLIIEDGRLTQKSYRDVYDAQSKREGDYPFIIWEFLPDGILVLKNDDKRDTNLWQLDGNESCFYVTQKNGNRIKLIYSSIDQDRFYVSVIHNSVTVQIGIFERVKNLKSTDTKWPPLLWWRLDESVFSGETVPETYTPIPKTAPTVLEENVYDGLDGSSTFTIRMSGWADKAKPVFRLRVNLPEWVVNQKVKV